MEINTKAFVQQWKEELKAELIKMNTTPKLLIIMAKDYSKPSKTYVNNKIKIGAELGIETLLHEIEWENKNKEELVIEIKNVINSYSDHAVIVQLPFPQITEEDLSNIIPANRDADGFTNEQKGKLISGSTDALIPCTALGVIKLLKHIHGDLTGKTIAIVNRSNLIGKPLLHLALQHNMTPTIIHTKTDALDASITIETSSIVVTGCGKRKLFNHRDFNDDFTETIIDCSMHTEEGIPGVGDCDKEDILKHFNNINIASGYGHTGLLTVCALFDNTIKIYKLK